MPVVGAGLPPEVMPPEQGGGLPAGASQAKMPPIGEM